MPNIEKYAAKSVYDPPIYAQAVKVTGAQTILYIAGQVDYDASGNCAHPGGTIANIVKMNTYVTDMRNRAEYGPIRNEFFGGKAPASTMVAVSALAETDYLIEIEAIAAI